MQLRLVLDGRLISHAIGALEQIEAETLRRFLLRGTRSALSSMLAEHASMMLTWILVRYVVAVHDRRAVLDLVRPWRLLGGDDSTQIDFRTKYSIGAHW